MAINKETRTLKSNSIEELRQKSNEVSLHVGDHSLLDSVIQDKIFTHTAAAGDYLVTPAATRFEYKPEETVDNTAGYILLTGSPTIGGGFAADASVTQSGGYSATIVSASTTKILVKNSTGTFSSSSTLTAGSDTIAGSAIRSLVAESYKKAELIVKVGSTVYTQDTTSTTGFHVPNHAGSVTITGVSDAADVSDFEEGAVAYQGSNLAGATWSGTILDCSTTLLRTKTVSGSFSASTQIKVDGGSDTIGGSNHGDITNVDTTFGSIIEFNTPLSSGNAVTMNATNLVDAINEVQDDIGTISTLASGISDRSDLVKATNSLKTEIGTASLTTSASTLRGAINEHETDIGTVGSLSTTATSLVNAINEHDTELGTISASAFGTSASTVSTAIAELHTDVDARLMLTKGTSQTINGNIAFSNAKTFTFPSGSTLDIRQGSLLTGSGAGELTFDTAFLTLTANDSSVAANQFGLEGRRVGSGKDVRIQFNETQVTGNKEARAWQLQGLDDSNASNTADIVTFYNAKELITNNTETGIDVTWDSTNQNFDFALSADPTITLAGDLGGTATLTNLTSATLTATIQAGSVENSMLAGGITNANLAGSIANAKLANSSITVSDGSNTSPVALGGTLTFAGTSGEVTVAENAGTVTVGLPDNVTVGGNLTITGNLDVNGTQTTINTSTLEIDDTLVLMGASATEPTTGGFGLETRSFTGVGTHSSNAANVTGSHSIVYNFATDRWEADGSLILSSATAGAPKIEGQLFESNDNLTFSAGTGLTEAVSVSGVDTTVTYTNSDKGSSQNIFKNVLSDSGTAVADTNNDTLSILGGNNLSTSTSADALTIQHTNSGVSAASYGSQFVVPSITVDARGHVTAASSNTAITLSALNYTGDTDANNYSFNITGDSGSANTISKTETLDIEGGTNVSTVVENNKIVINSVNTQYAVGDGELSQNNFTNADHTKLNGISPSANNYSFLIDGQSTGGTGTITNGEVLGFTGSGGATITRVGDNTININSANTTYSSSSFTITSLSGFPGGSTGFLRADGAFATPNYPSIPGVGNGGLTQINFTSALNTKLAGITAGATANTGTVTGVTGSNGVTSGGGTAPNLTMSGSYSGTFTVSGTINATGDVVASYSDSRLKDRKENITNALDKIETLNGFYYTPNDKAVELYDGDLDKNEIMVGVSAQEVYKVMPEVTSPAPIDNDYLTVDYGRMVPLLIEAIKELNAEIKELKSHK
jgi:hypothetical protein